MFMQHFIEMLHCFVKLVRLFLHLHMFWHICNFSAFLRLEMLWAVVMRLDLWATVQTVSDPELDTISLTYNSN